MHILFVDNTPDVKVLPITKELKERNFEFTYAVMTSVEGARKYIELYSNEIDLLVTALGLPVTASGEDYGSYRGLIVLDTALINNLKAPVIINTTDEAFIPHSDYLKNYSKENNIVIEEVKELTSDYLIEFIKKHQIDKTKEN